MKKTILMSILFVWAVCAEAAASQTSQELRRADWPQLQHDAQHTGYTPEAPAISEDDPRLAGAWRTDFLGFDPPQRIGRCVQVIAYGGKLFVPTLEGRLYALDPDTGEPVWQYDCGEGVNHTAAADNGLVFIATLKGSVYAIDAETGAPRWQWNNGLRTGFSSAVCLGEGKVFITGRGGDAHALDQASGKELWSFRAPSPIFQTAAYNTGRVFFAAEDMHCYALSAADGKLAWKSDKLAGMSFDQFYPLIYNGMVIVEAMPHGTHFGGGVDFDGYKFPLKVVWSTTDKELTDYCNGGNFDANGRLTEKAVEELIKLQDEMVERQIADPNLNLRAVLDAQTGKEACVLPLFLQSNNGAHHPPCVDRDGMLIAPVAFLRGFTFGRIDMVRRRFIDIFYPAFPGSANGAVFLGCQPGVAHMPGFGPPDENNAVAAAGPWVFWLHCRTAGIGPQGFINLETHKSGVYPENMLLHFVEPLPRTGAANSQSPHNRGHNAMYGACPPSIAYGYLYHQSYHFVHALRPAAPKQ